MIGNLNSEPETFKFKFFSSVVYVYMMQKMEPYVKYYLTKIEEAILSGKNESESLLIAKNCVQYYVLKTEQDPNEWVHKPLLYSTLLVIDLDLKDTIKSELRNIKLNKIIDL